MTDKERWEEIKEKYSEVTVLEYINDVEIVGVDIKDLVWLINRVDELEEENDELAERVHKLVLDWLELVDERNHYKQALEFYADENNWITPSKDVVLMDEEPETVEGPPLAIEDSGENARQALESDEN